MYTPSENGQVEALCTQKINTAKIKLIMSVVNLEESLAVDKDQFKSKKKLSIGTRRISVFN